MNYTLIDGEFFSALKKVSEEFERQEIKYALVGGTGIQARIADLFCRANRATISSVVGLEHLLRETKDFDITSNASEGDFVRYFNGLQTLNPHISVEPFSIRSKKLVITGKEKAIVRVNYQTGPQDLSGLDESFYNECLDSATLLDLRYGNQTASVRVAAPECLIASKLTRNDPKDIWDIGALLKTMRIYRNKIGKLKEAKIQDYLTRSGKSEMIGRLAEIKKQILKE